MDLNLTDAAWVPLTAAIITAVFPQPESKWGKMLWAGLNLLAINILNAKNRKEP